MILRTARSNSALGGGGPGYILQDIVGLGRTDERCRKLRIRHRKLNGQLLNRVALALA
jgi:hypothetical protein